MLPQILSAALYQVRMESQQPDQHFYLHQYQLPGGTNQDYSRNTAIDSLFKPEMELKPQII